MFEMEWLEIEKEKLTTVYTNVQGTETISRSSRQRVFEIEIVNCKSCIHSDCTSITKGSFSSIHVNSKDCKMIRVSRSKLREGARHG